MEALILSTVYGVIIIGLLVIRFYQKRHIRVKNGYNNIKSVKSIDLDQLKCNYEILNKMLDNIDKETNAYEQKHYSKKVS